MTSRTDEIHSSNWVTRRTRDRRVLVSTRQRYHEATRMLIEDIVLELAPLSLEQRARERTYP